MKDIFKKGDRVFAIKFGWGTVKKVGPLVFVKFDNGVSEEFYPNGNFYSEDLHPFLSFTEYTLQGFSQERPNKEPEIGSLCLFSDDEEEFDNNIGVVGKLIFIKKDSPHPYNRENGSDWKYCKQIKIEEI